MKFNNTIKLIAFFGVLIIIGVYIDDYIGMRSFTGDVEITMWDDFEHHRGGHYITFYTDKSRYRLKILNAEDVNRIFNYNRYQDSGDSLLNVNGYLIGDTLVVKSVRVVGK